MQLTTYHGQIGPSSPVYIQASVIISLVEHTNKYMMSEVIPHVNATLYQQRLAARTSLYVSVPPSVSPVIDSVMVAKTVQMAQMKRMSMLSVRRNNADVFLSLAVPLISTPVNTRHLLRSYGDSTLGKLSQKILGPPSIIR